MNRARDIRPGPRAVAAITGASSGLGEEFARALAARGHDLILVARRRERLAQLSGELRQTHGIVAEVHAADLACEADLEDVARRIAAEERLELLVNNAGFGTVGYFHEAPLAAQLAMHRVHILATLSLTHAALPRLVARNRGGIINVSSVAAFARLPGASSYNSTKAWMNAFTESLHLELRSSGSAVRVQALCPGYTYTEFHDVVGLDRREIMPQRGFWMTPAFVVAESLKNFDRGRSLSIPGWRYRALVFLLKAFPRFLIDPLTIRVARRRKASARAATSDPA